MGLDIVSYEMGRQDGYKKGEKAGEKTIDLTGDITFSVDGNNEVTLTKTGGE